MNDDHDKGGESKDKEHINSADDSLPHLRIQSSSQVRSAPPIRVNVAQRRIMSGSVCAPLPQLSSITQMICSIIPQLGTFIAPVDPLRSEAMAEAVHRL